MLSPSAVLPSLRHEEAVAMGKHKVKPNYRRRLLRLPDLDHCKRAEVEFRSRLANEIICCAENGGTDIWREGPLKYVEHFLRPAFREVDTVFSEGDTVIACGPYSTITSYCVGISECSTEKLNAT
jgi:hypothetical protein